MSQKGHVQPRMKKDKDHAVVGRGDPTLVDRQREQFDPIKLKPRHQSLKSVPRP